MRWYGKVRGLVLDDQGRVLVLKDGSRLIRVDFTAPDYPVAVYVQWPELSIRVRLRQPGTLVVWDVAKGYDHFRER